MSAPSRPADTVVVDMATRVGAFEVSATFTAGPGVTALFGPSGAGKSVTLATIAGLLRPVRGSIVLGGMTVADAAAGVHVPTQDRGLGAVFQDAALLAHRSPLDNVALAARNAPDRRTRRLHARTWLDRVGAGHLADAPTGTLSGGEQQRVGLARALAGEPSTVLLDEPFSALDQATRIALRSLVRQLVDEQRITALLVTHDLDDVAALGDRVVRYEPGRTRSTHDLPAKGPRRLPHLLELIR